MIGLARIGRVIRLAPRVIVMCTFSNKICGQYVTLRTLTQTQSSDFEKCHKLPPNPEVARMRTADRVRKRLMFGVDKT
jgi:hypothetical protein